MKKTIFVCLLLILCLPGLIFAQDRPSATEAKKVLEYYYYGQDQGAVLVDSRFCSDIVKDGENKNNPVDKLNSAKIEKGSKVFLWMYYFMATGDEGLITISYINKGKPRKIQEVKITGSFRFRSWKIIPTNRTGDWEVVITQEMENETEIELGKITYTVVEPG